MIEKLPHNPLGSTDLLYGFARDNRAATAIEYSLIAAIAGLALVVFAEMAAKTAYTPALDVLDETLSRQPVKEGGHQVH